MEIKNEPTRDAECFFDDNAKPDFRSCLSPKEVKVWAECKLFAHFTKTIFFIA